MMVALVVTLIMMAAVIGAFSMASGSINDGRSMMEMADRVRSAAERLKLDLAGVTARATPWLRPEAGEGYLEIIEGPYNDTNPQVPGDTIYGDTDDVLLFTTRSTGEPFVNSFGQQSQVAEVAWICVPNVDKSGKPVPPSNPNYTLYRVSSLVLPGIDPKIASQGEVSTRAGDSSGIVPCTLGDLTKREYRTNAVRNTAFPYEFNAQKFIQTVNANPALYAKFVALTNVVGFDVKVWDPAAVTYTSGTVQVVPGDPGYGSGTAGALGAYVDLGYKATTPSFFSGPPQPASKTSGAAWTNATWDTWPMHYEYDGPAMDGVRNNAGAGGVDDVSERVTQAPYNFPLRGVQIKLRVYEPDSRQVQEVTVIEQFLPD
jgi:hypothetical protein